VDDVAGICKKLSARSAGGHAAPLAGLDPARADRRRANMGRAGIPRRFAGADFGAYAAVTQEQRRVLAVVRRYADGFRDVMAHGRNLALLGSPGTGKTHLACAVLRQVISRGATGRYRPAVEAVRDVRQGYDRHSGISVQDALDGLCRVDLLVIDDVGAQAGTANEQTILHDIIDGRYREQRPTIIVANLTEAELPQYIGERAADRIYDGGAVLACSWPSYRRQVNK